MSNGPAKTFGRKLLAVSGAVSGVVSVVWQGACDQLRGSMSASASAVRIAISPVWTTFSGFLRPRPEHLAKYHDLEFRPYHLLIKQNKDAVRSGLGAFLVHGDTHNDDSTLNAGKFAFLRDMLGSLAPADRGSLVGEVWTAAGLIAAATRGRSRCVLSRVMNAHARPRMVDPQVPKQH